MANDDLKNFVDDIVEKSKGVFEQTTKKASEYAKVASGKASDLFDTAKQKIQTEKLEFAMSKKFRELGKAYYEAKANGTAFDDTTLINDIKTLQEAILALKEDKPISPEAEDIVEKEEEL